MAKSTDAGDGKKAKDRKVEDELDPFVLETVFPNPIDSLSLPSIKTDEIASDALFVLDTCALLEPFVVGKAGQDEITTLYSNLRENRRLYAPERVLQEYLRNRSKKIVDMHLLLNQRKSDLEKAPAHLACAMLDYSPEYQALTEATEVLKKARKQYLAKLEDLINVLANWRWDDPVSRLYANIFDKEIVIKCSESHDELKTNLAHRIKYGLPPGYKDKGKGDGGIGDLIIWHSILKLGREKQTGIVFVTNDEKPDWMVRSNGEALFPRFELVAEFHRKTNQQLAIVNYARFLELNELSGDTVEKVRHSNPGTIDRFKRLRHRIVSILESLNGIASDYSYSSISECPNPIRDDRFSGLIAEFDKCSSLYGRVLTDGHAAHYLERFMAVLSEMKTLNYGIEYEEVRLKRDTTKAERELKVLCEMFMEQWLDFSELTSNKLEW